MCLTVRNKHSQHIKQALDQANSKHLSMCITYRAIKNKILTGHRFFTIRGKGTVIVQDDARP